MLSVRRSVFSLMQGCTKIVDGRKLACYGGVAPFEYRSGTSIMGKTGVSKFANGELKRVLHMAAISSIQHNPELKQYYTRKVEEGKSKMSVINAVRNNCSIELWPSLNVEHPIRKH